MKYRLVYEPGAPQLIRRLSPHQKPVIKRAIESLRHEPFAGKELHLELAGYRSLRTRRYRIIYRVVEKPQRVAIHYFGPRRDVYDVFRDLVRHGLRAKA